jgi:MFS family permease
MLVEIITGLGVAMGISVGALLTKDMAGVKLSGVAQSAAVIGGALMAVPASALMQRKGRRPGLAACYLVGSLGGVGVLMSSLWNSLPLLFIGFFFFGAGNTGKLQARYAAIDLATPQKRGRHLSLVVWSTTLGAVIGPLLAAPIATTLPNVPQLAAPFAFASLSFLIGAAAVTLLLRPDPLLLSQTLSPRTTEKSPGLKAAWRAVLASPPARLGISAMAVGHLVMVAVMAMTPLHIGETHSQADTIKIVGIVISAHIAGMYGLSPVVGWLTDKLGRRPVILGGIAVLVAACAVAGTSGHRTPQLTVALVMLGLGWSATMVAGSTLFSESIPVQLKAPAQGLADLSTGLTGASAGLLSGVIVGYSGYAVLTLLAALATLPLIALALRPLPRPVAETS